MPIKIDLKTQRRTVREKPTANEQWYLVVYKDQSPADYVDPGVPRLGVKLAVVCTGNRSSLLRNRKGEPVMTVIPIGGPSDLDDATHPRYRRGFREGVNQAVREVFGPASKRHKKPRLPIQLDVFMVGKRASENRGSKVTQPR